MYYRALDVRCINSFQTHNSIVAVDVKPQVFIVFIFLFLHLLNDVIHCGELLGLLLPLFKDKGLDRVRWRPLVGWLCGTCIHRRFQPCGCRPFHEVVLIFKVVEDELTVTALSAFKFSWTERLYFIPSNPYATARFEA